MKNRMWDVRNHLVAAMESLADHDVSDQVIARAKVCAWPVEKTRSRKRWKARRCFRGVTDNG